MNRNKILFLDCDGVINTISRSYDKAERDAARKNCARASKQLSRILKETDCGVVVSSSWRTIPAYMNGNIAYVLEREFKLPDFVSHYVGDTPDLNVQLPYEPEPFDFEKHGKYVERGVEIQKWLTDNSYEGRFAILDDIPDEFEGLTDHLFLTQLEIGITSCLADAVIKYLNENN